MKKEITIDSWLELVRMGANVPAHTTLDGISMEPLIRKGKDIVTVMPLARELRRGDIVLFQRGDGVYVVHRVMEIKDDKVITLGDNCIGPDAPLERNQILGIVTEINRDGKIINPYDKKYTEYGKRKLRTVVLRKVEARCKNTLRYIASNVIRGN